MEWCQGTSTPGKREREAGGEREREKKKDHAMKEKVAMEIQEQKL